ncbi:MAG: ABC transporter ATP-binding protein [Clostridiales bacterium]|nr:ABC transporter ATP-binding protein [Clostridiales bacterium]
MLSLKNVSKSYGKSSVKAVDNLSLEVKPGEIFGFLGPNGAGKSTTIKLITGILRPDQGSIEIDGHDITRDAVAAKKRIGYVPDNHAVYDKLKGIEYINFMADIYEVSRKEREERANYFLEKFNLKDAANSPIKTYSHGMRQKICIIGALIHNPRLWILDEPMTGLDPQSSHILKQQMREHCDKGNTVFFSSHILEVVEKICDRVGIIDKGRLVAVGTIEELKSRGDSSLEEFFLKLTSGEGNE